MDIVKPFTYCLNTSTIRGQSLNLPDEIKVVARSGYDGIEPWVREIDTYLASGGSLRELRLLIEDAGLHVPNIIGFFEWTVDDDQERAEGLAEARRNMEMCAALGCHRIAAPPFGATKVNIHFHLLIERYRALYEIGQQMDVVPMIEFWGISQTLQRLSESVAIALQAGQEKACILADVFHMAKGGSPFEGLHLIGPHTLGLLHLNDYPAGSLALLTDADRVYPGDGIAPLDSILATLFEVGYRGALSIELFNAGYWEHDALLVAQTALLKTQQSVANALNLKV